MACIDWAPFPTVAILPSAREWLEMQANRQLSPRTIEAYGRGLEEWLRFCGKSVPNIVPETASRADLALYVNALASRSGRREGTLLSRQTISLRLTAARLYYDHLVETGVRNSNPIGRSRNVRWNHGTASPRLLGGRPLFRHKHQPPPWIPTDAEFAHLLTHLGTKSVRNQAMVMLLYDGALRRDELVKLELDDIDWPDREVLLRPEICKNGFGRLVLFTRSTSVRLNLYLDQRRVLRTDIRLLFLSESNRNKATGISANMVNKIVQNLAVGSALPKLHPHTFRHLRLTHMARCGVPDHIIAQYAGHRSLDTTRLYIHLSGRDISIAVAQKMSDLDNWIASALQGTRKGGL